MSTSPNELLTALRDHLEAAGLIRRPADAGPLPPCFVEPIGGAPAPGERQGVENDAVLMLSVMHSTTIAEQPFDTYRRRFAIDFRYRSRGTAGLKAGRELDAAIRDELLNRPDYGFAYTLAEGEPSALRILQAHDYAPLSPLSFDADSGHTENAKIVFEVLAV